jgi:hypothetical protein
LELENAVGEPTFLPQQGVHPELGACRLELRQLVSPRGALASMPAAEAQCLQGHFGSITFDNSMLFELASEDSSEGIAAELQAARLRLEAAEGDRQGLAAELAGTQGRLHIALVRFTPAAFVVAGSYGNILPPELSPPSLCSCLACLPACMLTAATVPPHTGCLQEVLEGVLSERSSLLKQTHELQAQLAAALADQRHSRESLGASSASSSDASSAEGSPNASSATSRRQLRQELLLAQVGLLSAAAAAAESAHDEFRRHCRQSGAYNKQASLAAAFRHAGSAGRCAAAAGGAGGRAAAAGA